MKASKAEIVNLFVSLGFESAKNWGVSKLNKKIKRLPTVVESLNEDQLSLTDEQTEILSEILDCIIGEEDIEITGIEPDDTETVIGPETETETETEPEIKEKEKKAIKPKVEAKPQRQKLPPLIVDIIKKQTGEFKLQDILNIVGTETGYPENSIKVHINMALIYGEAFGEIKRVSRSVYTAKKG